jgi:Flp pilus assembly protein TadG
MERTRKRDGERAQELVEFGIIIVLFVTLAVGVVTFGHAFMVANMITHAARDGARLAATWPTRGACQRLDNSNTGPIQATVRNEIATVTGTTFTINVGQSPVQPAGPPCVSSTTPLVSVTVTGCVPYVFPILPAVLGVDCNGRKGFAVNRTVTFHDEAI